MEADAARSARQKSSHRRKLLSLARSPDRVGEVRRFGAEVLSWADAEQQEEVTKFVGWARDYADRLEPVAHTIGAMDEGTDLVEPEHEDGHPPEPSRYGW